MESSQQFQNRVAGRTLDDFEVKSLLFCHLNTYSDLPSGSHL